MKGVDQQSLSVDTMLDVSVVQEVLTADKRRVLQQTIDTRIAYQAVVGVFGKSSSGKSSLCNALSGNNECEVFVPEGVENTTSAVVDSSNRFVVPCTRYPQEVTLAYRNHCGLSLIDTPGFGSYQKKDKALIALYRDLLPELDMILWVVGADESKGKDEGTDQNNGQGKDESFPEVQTQILALIQRTQIPVLLVVNQIAYLSGVSEVDESGKAGYPRNGHVLSTSDLALGFYSRLKREHEGLSLFPDQVCFVSATGNIGLVSLLEKILRFLPEQRQPFADVDTGALISPEVLMSSETFVPPDVGISSGADESSFALSSAEKHTDHIHQFVLKNV